MLTALVALYGAGLSTYNLLQARSRDARKVRVTMSTIVAELVPIAQDSTGKEH